jgi:hypothetical protein
MNRNVPTRHWLAVALILALGSAAGTAAAQALTSTFTYQGELRLTSGPATGSYDMEFRLYGALVGGVQIGSTVSLNAVSVTGGLFAVPLNFGSTQFAGERQFLEVRIRPAGLGSFETLTPRSEVTAAPYAWAARVALADAVTTTSIIDGSVGAQDINPLQVQQRVTGGCAAGQYVRVVNQDGTVVCGTDVGGGGGGGTVTSVGSGAGLTGGPVTTAGTLSIATGGVTGPMIQDGAVAGVDIADGAIGSLDVADGAIGAVDVDVSQVQRRVSGNCPSGEYIRIVNTDGTVVCGTDVGGGGGGGTVTSVGSGAGLTGGPVTTSGTLSIATGGVTGAMIQDGAVAGVDIADGAIGAIDVDATQIQRRVSANCPAGQYVRLVNQDGTVVCGNDAGGSVTSVGTGAGLTGGPITGSGTIAIAAGGVNGAMIQDGSVAAADVDSTQVQRRVNGNCPTGQYVRVVNVDGTVVCGTDVGGGGGGGTVTSVATGAGLTGGPITASGTIEIATGGVTGAMLQDDTVTAADLANASVTTLEIADGTIATSDINATQVQRRVTGSCTGSNFVQLIAQDGSVSCGASPAGSGWTLAGNAATNPAINFVGTTDAQPLVLRTNNVQSARIEPSSVTDAGGSITANVVLGSRANTANAGVRGATIAGGGVPAATNDPDLRLVGAENRVLNHYGTVGGGWNNRAGDGVGGAASQPFATVGGGSGNAAFKGYSTVAGGDTNFAGAVWATIGGGRSNSAIGLFAAVAGGEENAASGAHSAVAGGEGNNASGLQSAVSGGVSNCAGGDQSWAGGRRAKVRPGSDPGGSGACVGLGPYPGGQGDVGTFVWADSQNANFVSSGDDQFLVRASGGMVVTGGAANDPLGNRLRVHGGTLRVDQLGAAGSLALCRNTDNQLATCSSSARYKFDIEALDTGLQAALRLRAVGYRWKGSGEADVGFVAEEIAAIDERLVTRNERGEVEGVKYDRLTAVLANAVQELAARASLAGETLVRLESAHDDLAAENVALRSEAAGLRAESAELRAELDRRDAEYRTRLERLEARLSGETGTER